LEVRSEYGYDEPRSRTKKKLKKKKERPVDALRPVQATVEADEDEDEPEEELPFRRRAGRGVPPIAWILGAVGLGLLLFVGGGVGLYYLLAGPTIDLPAEAKSIMDGYERNRGGALTVEVRGLDPKTNEMAWA
jgi:hypothetical protein